VRGGSPLVILTADGQYGRHGPSRRPALENPSRVSHRRRLNADPAGMSMMRPNKATLAGESASNRDPYIKALISIVHVGPKHSPRNKRMPRQSNALSDRA
jgi:hypothetical protein